MALDFDADPRSALWLRIAGARRAVSYARPYSGLFDRSFPLPGDPAHQADRNAAVVRGFLARPELRKRLQLMPARPLEPECVSASLLPLDSAPWIISCHTRREAKNWPLERWDALLEKMAGARLPLLILDAPDGGEDFRRFRERWSSRVGFLRQPLAAVSAYVRNSAGAVATDNFLGHMAGYYGKPVLWINGSSDPGRVMPQGPFTCRVQVEPMPCRPCFHRCVNPKPRECLETLGVEEVWKAFEDLRRLAAPG
jgi:ADP-heptose:LPS heptosyltransferase